MIASFTHRLRAPCWIDRLVVRLHPNVGKVPVDRGKYSLLGPVNRELGTKTDDVVHEIRREFLGDQEFSPIEMFRVLWARERFDEEARFQEIVNVDGSGACLV